MILGIGNDLVDIRRIEKLLEQFGERFEQRIFTSAELALANARKDAKVATLAKRFAAKEACLKALGEGLSGIRWTDMEVTRESSGRPVMRLSGQALKALEKLTPTGKSVRVDLSLSDEYPYAQAFVVISAA